MNTEFRFKPRVFIRIVEGVFEASCLDFDSQVCDKEQTTALDKCFLGIANLIILHKAKRSLDLDILFPSWASGIPIPYTNSFDITVKDVRWRIEGLDVRIRE